MQEKLSQINIITFGCRLNALESEIIRKYAVTAGLEKFNNIFIFNTCAVTAEAERQVAQSVRKYKRNYPDSIIILAGCSANASSDKYINMNEVDFVIGNKEKVSLKTYQDIYTLLKNGYGNAIKKSKTFLSNLKNTTFSTIDDLDLTVENFTDRTRAFIQIQQGCKNRCTFCIVSILRGNSVSFPIEKIFDQVKTVVKNGYKEIILTGVDIASYGDKIMNSLPLAKLLKEISMKFPTIKRIRLSSLDPAYNYNELINLARYNTKIMPHFHLSLQHASDKILRLMGRRHTRKQALDLCKNIRKKIGNHTAIGADVITGFPNETEEDFKLLLKFIKQAKITHLHTFVYSPRPNTFAYDHMVDNVPKNVAKLRAKILRKAAKNNMKHLMRISEKRYQYVLLEHNGQSGYTENYIKCNIINPKETHVKNYSNMNEIRIEELSENDIVKVKIIKNRIVNEKQEIYGIAVK